MLALQQASFLLGWKRETPNENIKVAVSDWTAPATRERWRDSCGATDLSIS
jgi:hypothetical protein